MKRVFASIMIPLILVGLISVTLVIHYTQVWENEEQEPFYVGVSFCGNTTLEGKLLIDRVKTYTNLLVLQSGPISKNETATNEICDYAVASGLNIIVYFGWFDPDYPWQLPWLDFAKHRWGDRFLGVYYYDEPGGIQLDTTWSHYFNDLRLQNSSLYQQHASAIDSLMNGSLAKDYDLAAQLYVDAIAEDLGIRELKKHSIVTFTSDYALYWFDYLGGYDVVLAQLGWNHTLTNTIGLVRGAARLQGKPWGVIITWKYKNPPYLDNGENIYQQMLMSYEAGAKYVLIFNYPRYPESNDYGVMADEHFEALERFWNDVMEMPQNIHGSVKAEAAFVLPNNYGWGMRYPEDKIWFWQAGEQDQKIWELLQNTFSEHNSKLDIVFDDSAYPVAEKYPHLHYWNQTS